MMLHSPAIRRVLAALSLLPLIACGQTQLNNPKTPDEIKATLEKTYAEQKLTIRSVQPAPVKGWFEVVLPDNQIVYVDGDVKYMMAGSLIDLGAKKDLTAERTKALNVIDFSSLPLENAITEVRGSGKYKVAVFSDPDCPFCHRLEKEFAKMTDVTIYTLLMPIDALHPAARAKSEQIWCQKDRTAAWTAWMREGKAPAKVAACPNPVEKTIALGEELGFTGTPTVVFPNGQVQMGYAPQDVLQQAIEQNQ